MSCPLQITNMDPSMDPWLLHLAGSFLSVFVPQEGGSGCQSGKPCLHSGSLTGVGLGFFPISSIIPGNNESVC